jgi:hypothetical protein
MTPSLAILWISSIWIVYPNSQSDSMHKQCEIIKFLVVLFKCVNACKWIISKRLALSWHFVKGVGWSCDVRMVIRIWMILWEPFAMSKTTRDLAETDISWCDDDLGTYCMGGRP